MSELPKGWVETKLGEISQLEMGQSPPGTATNSDAKGIPLIGGASDFVGEQIKPNRFTSAPTKICQPNDLILCVRATIGKLAVAESTYCLGRGVAGIRPRNINQDWLRYRLISDASALDAAGTGSTFRQIDKQTLVSWNINLPPLNEQRRIVAKLDRLFARSRCAREELARVSGLVQRYKQAILAAACSGKLTEDWREKNPNIETGFLLSKKISSERQILWERSELEKMSLSGKIPKDDSWRKKYKMPLSIDSSKLPDLPDTWVWTTVEEISTKVVDGVHKKPNYVEKGIPFVTVKNLTAGNSISFDGLNYVTEQDHEEFSKRANPQRGDLLITKDGTLGVVRVVRTDVVFSIFVSVAMIKPVSYQMSDYLEIALSSPIMQDQMLGTGTGLMHIHLIDLRGYGVPLPPLEEQKEIVKRVEKLFKAIDLIEQEHQKASQLLDRLEQATLSKAFRGELVTQDPNDEPAAGLLERIQSDRQGQPKGKAIKSPQKPGKRTRSSDREVNG